MDVIAKTFYGWKFSENVYFLENYFILLFIW